MSTDLVPSRASIVLEAREVQYLPFCGACGQQGERLKRLGGIGRRLCPNCYQRARRAAEAAFEELRAVALVATNDVLYSFLLGKGLAPRSIKLYMRTVWNAERWFTANRWHLARATPIQIVTYAETLPMSFASQSLLRIALAHYWELTEHPRPPVRAIRVPQKAAMVCRALEDDDARILAKAARARGDRKGLAVMLGLYQAMRREEIATARRDALDGDWITVFGKGAKNRTIPLHPAVAEALAGPARSGAYVFPGRVNGHVSPASIWNWVREVADEAGVGLVRPHWLRHTALATQNDATGDLRAVQHFAGHARSATTEGYTRASRSALLRVSRALDY